MTPERWQQIRNVLEKALELAPSERSAFLNNACSSDQSLRQEVETLLASENDPHSGFLQSFTLRVTLASGTKLGDYEVKSLLGSGGMGEVYRARDSRLGRDVAIKVLPSFLSADSDRLRRFEQEARAAAALSHPNILAVFQMSTYEGTPYLVSELLEGETLREQVMRGRLSVCTAIDYCLQIVRGLVAAHDKGIVHRDLKPENLFVTKDGRLKILDFGLAKLTQPQSSSEHSELTLIEGTEAGVVMGTVGYMSPEQVRGQTADHRADIFAFGAILYEMLAGKRAFQKPTSAETMTAILNEDPPGISQVTTNIPAALQRVVHRCLEKNPEQRFQSASDLAFAVDALSEKSGSVRVYPGKEGGWRGLFAFIREHRLWTAEGLGSSLPAASRNARLVALVVASLALLVVGFAIFLWRHTGAHAGASWVQITNFADSAVSPALSSDGRMITFIRGPETFVTPGQIYVKMLPDGQPVQLTHDNLRKMAPVFSPDGSRIAYTATNTSFGWNTWIMPVLGGEPKETLPNAAALTWIDKQHLLFSEIKTGIRMALVTAEESRSGERDVYVPANKAGMAHRSWLSPDRKWVLVSEMDDIGWQPCRLLPFDGSSAGTGAGPQKSKCTYAAWSPDGKWMYFSADAGDGFHLWRQRFPKAAPEQITFGPTEEEGIAVAQDGRSLVTSVGSRQGSVWLHDAKGDRQISSEGFAALPGLGFGELAARSVFSPDGKKLFYFARKKGSRAFNSGELRMADLESGQEEVVLPGILMNDFDLAQDGNRIAFASFNEQGSSRVWMAALDHRTPPRQVTSIESDRPSFGPAGTLFFRGREGDSDIVYRVELNDTKPRRISVIPVPGFYVVSPDGEWCVMNRPPEMAQPLRGGPKFRICDSCEVGWGPSGKYFYVRLRDTGFMGGGKVYVIALPAGKSLPALPLSGIKSAESFKGLNVVSVIGMTGLSIFAPGPNPSTYAYSRMTVQRNLFRIPLN
jgi:serine/threonine protein kinase/Tol biopolymer transport system component